MGHVSGLSYPSIYSRRSMMNSRRKVPLSPRAVALENRREIVSLHRCIEMISLSSCMPLGQGLQSLSTAFTLRLALTERRLHLDKKNLFLYLKERNEPL